MTALLKFISGNRNMIRVEGFHTQNLLKSVVKILLSAVVQEGELEFEVHFESWKLENISSFKEGQAEDKIPDYSPKIK